MDKTKPTPQEASRKMRQGGDKDERRETTINPQPRQDQYPSEDEPTPNYDGYPVHTMAADDEPAETVGELAPRLNNKAGDYEHDEVVFDKKAAADQRDKPKSPYAD